VPHVTRSSLLSDSSPWSRRAASSGA